LKIGLAFGVMLLLTVFAATGNVTANNVIAEQGAPNFNESYTYTFIKDVGYDKDVEVIKVQFKNVLRGADSNLAHIDRVWQVSDTNSSQVIINDSHGIMFTSGAPLKLGEGYELAIRSIDIGGESANLELSKNGKVVDSTVIIPPNVVEDTYTYTQDLDRSGSVDVIKVHFKNAFRGADSNLATIDRILQVSDTNSSQKIINNSQEMMITSGTPLKLEEGYKLALKGMDIDGNKVYVELSKSGVVVDVAEIIPLNAVDDTYTFTRDLDNSKAVEIIKIHFKNAFRGADQNLATVDRVWQVSDTNSSHTINDSSKTLTLASGTPLTLGEGYELVLKSIDIDGSKMCVELSKKRKVVDSAVIILPAPALFNKGLTFYHQGKYVEAISAFDEAIEIDPQYAAALCYKSFTLNELGKHDEATSPYDKAIEIDPQYVAAAWENKGNDLEQSKRYDDALEAYNRAIDLDPKDARTWFGKGYVLSKQAELNESMKAYDKAIEIDPEYAMAWSNKAANLLDLGINDDALKASEKAIGMDSELAIAWRNKGNALDGLARYDEAIQSYNKASSIDQMYSVSMIDMGNSHYNAGEYVAAIRYYDEAIKEDPKDEYAWYNKAMALRMLHRDSEAKAAYAKARELGYSGTMTLMEMTTK
jgi:tetratricopeptide (TPR) repeat protein